MAAASESQYDSDDRSFQEGDPLWNFPYPTPDTLTKEYLEKLIVELKRQGAYDPEVAHSLEKKTMECFIVNVVAKKYTTEEASEIGQLILGIWKIPFSRWFA